MKKRNSFEIRKEILALLKNKSMTLSELERKVNTNSRTIKNDCEELEYYKLISLRKQVHPSNGKISHNFALTKNGLEIIKH